MAAGPPNPAMAMLGGAPPQGGPPPQGAPPPMPPPPPPPPLGGNPMQQVYPWTAPAAGSTYQIDPLVLDRPVRIKIEASSRMVGRAQLQQDFQALSQAILNPALLPGLAEAQMSIDWPEVLRMFNDASSSGRLYKWVRPMTPQEMQARQQPNPQQQQDMQKAQLDAQTRQTIMQMKVQSDQQLAAMDQRMQELQMQEDAAKHILQLIVQEKLDLSSRPDPQAEAQATAQQNQMDLQHQMASRQMDLQGQQQQNAMKLRQMQLEHQTKAHQSVQNMMLDSMKARQQLAFQAQQQQLQAQAPSTQ